MKFSARMLQIIILCSLYFICPLSQATAQEKTPVILDADTGNEVDDYYALTRALIEPSWEVLALNATQWQASQWSIPHSMENSHRLNHVLLGELGLSVKTRRGGVDRMFDWGDMAQHSAAAYEIIQQAKAMAPGQKLKVIALGALTNVASAIYIDPSIEDRIELYWLGTSYDFEKGILKRQDFNCVMDVQALETLLMSKVVMNVIPVNVAVHMEFQISELKQLPAESGLTRILEERWFDHLDNGRKKRHIWDLALIQAMLHPEWAEVETITTSKDNGNRPINYYKTIQVDKMKTEFFNAVNQYLNQ